MIALPSHGWVPRPLNIVTGQVGPPIYSSFAGGDVFGKQARLVFAEFLPFLLVFPWWLTSVGLTIGYMRFSCLLFKSCCSLVLSSLMG